MCRAMKAWRQFQEHQQHKRSMMQTALRHFETTLIKHSMCGWRQKCLHAPSSEHGSGAGVRREACRHQGVPEAHSEHFPGCVGCGARPSSAGAGPKVGRQARVVVGHVRRASGNKRRPTNQKRSQSAPRIGGFHPSQCDTAIFQKQVLGMPCATADTSTFAGLGTEGMQTTRQVTVIHSLNGFKTI
jgi:hypothetical protein